MSFRAFPGEPVVKIELPTVEGILSLVGGLRSRMQHGTAPPTKKKSLLHRAQDSIQTVVMGYLA